MSDKIHKIQVGYLLGQGKEEEFLQDPDAELGHFLASPEFNASFPKHKLPSHFHSLHYQMDVTKISQDIVDILSLEKRGPNNAEKELIKAIQNIDSSDFPVQAQTMLETLKQKLLHCNKKIPNIDILKNVVAEYFDMTVEVIEKETRKRGVVKPRQIIMFLATGMGLGSLAEIGGQIGGKDHATVLHARKTISGLLDVNCKFTIKQMKGIIKILQTQGYFDINFFKEDKYNTKSNLEKLI